MPDFFDTHTDAAHSKAASSSKGDFKRALSTDIGTAAFKPLCIVPVRVLGKIGIKNLDNLQQTMEAALSNQRKAMKKGNSIHDGVVMVSTEGVRYVLHISYVSPS